MHCVRNLSSGASLLPFRLDHVVCAARTSLTWPLTVFGFSYACLSKTTMRVPCSLFHVPSHVFIAMLCSCSMMTAWFAWISAFISFCCSTISLMRLFDHIVCSHSQRVRFAKLRCVGFTVPSSTSAVPKTSSTTLLIRSHQSGQC